jgi:hypothetical protein
MFYYVCRAQRKVFKITDKSDFGFMQNIGRYGAEDRATDKVHWRRSTKFEREEIVG